MEVPTRTPTLTALALVAVRDCILDGDGPQSLAPLPSEFANMLMAALSDRLCTSTCARARPTHTTRRLP